MKRAPISKYAPKETRARFKRLVTASRHAAKHSDDPEAIHDLRVSIRRLSQCLRTFDQLFDPAQVKKLRRRLRKLMDLCAAVRNRDVALSLLHQIGITSGASVSKLKKARSSSQAELHLRLKKDRRRRRPSISTYRTPPAGDWKLEQNVAVNLGRILPALVEDFFEVGTKAALADASPRRMHQFRLRAKRFRYTLEIFERFYGSEMELGEKDLKDLQDRLGDINDCVTTIGLLGPDRRAAAAIRKLLDQRTVEFQGYWRSQFPLRKLAWWKRWLSHPRIAGLNRAG